MTLLSLILHAIFNFLSTLISCFIRYIHNFLSPKKQISEILFLIFDLSFIISNINLYCGYILKSIKLFLTIKCKKSPLSKIKHFNASNKQKLLTFAWFSIKSFIM